MHIVDIYPTKGRDRATPLKPYKAGNIWDMPYKCCVLYFLDLSLKRSFFHRNAFFRKKNISKSKTIIDPCLIRFLTCSVKLLSVKFKNILFQLLHNAFAISRAFLVSVT